MSDGRCSSEFQIFCGHLGTYAPHTIHTPSYTKMTRKKTKAYWKSLLLKPVAPCLKKKKTSGPSPSSAPGVPTPTKESNTVKVPIPVLEDPCTCQEGTEYEELTSMQLNQTLKQVESDMSHPLGWALTFLKSQSNEGHLDVSQWYRQSAQLDLDTAPLMSTNPFVCLPNQQQTWPIPLTPTSKGLVRRLVYHVSVGQLGIICHSDQAVTSASPGHLSLTIRTWFPNAPMGFGKKFYSETVFCCTRGPPGSLDKTEFRILWKSWFHKSVPMKGELIAP